jgi:lipopolysaccharide transport system permease protein
MRQIRLLIELTRQELKSQRKETFLGLLLMVVWPFVQAGGFLLAFSIIRGGGFGQSLLVTYLGVLVWSTWGLVITTSAAFFTKNSELIRHLVFPFHLIVATEVNVKYLFFLVQAVVGGLFVLLSERTSSLGEGLVGLFVFFIGSYLLLLGLAWLFSLVGAVVPDLVLALPALLTLLLALSPVFQFGSTVPLALQVFNDINPLSIAVESFYGAIGARGEVEIPWIFAGVCAVSFLVIRVGVKKIYRELAKIA